MRIFLLGDSFTDNRYPYMLQKIRDGEDAGYQSNVGEYVKKIKEANLPDPLHFEDYLKMWGHEVINFGSDGCTNYSIFYSFFKIDQEFREGDRIIVNWTGMNRYDWIGKRGNVMSINGGLPDDYDTNPKTKVIFDQYIHRMESSKPGGYLYNHMPPFMEYLLRLNERYKPIMWIPNDFPNEAFTERRFYALGPSDEIFKDIIPEFKKLTIEGEAGINDRHFGRWGNFYCAVIFNTILEYTSNINHNGYYTKDRDLFSLIEGNIKKSIPNLIDIPKNRLSVFKHR
jgi:hypothetical protein